MRRKSLLLLLFVPVLLLLLLFTLSGVQALPGTQTASPAAQQEPLTAQDPAAEQAPGDPADPAAGEPQLEGVPLEQPLSIRIRQTIPLTVALNLLRPITATLSPTDTLIFTGLAPITDTQPVTLALDTGAGPGAPAETITETLPITGATVITGLLPITEPLPLDSGLAVTPSTALTEVLAVPVAVAEGAAAVEGLAEVTGTLPITAPAVLLAADTLTTVPPIFTGVGITMELDLQILVTDTLTSTVPATLVLRFGGMPALTLPVSISVNAPPTATLFVEPVELAELPAASEAPTETAAVTLTGEVTVTPPLTETAEATATTTATVTATPIDVEALAVVTVTVPVTTNVRLTPVIDAEIVRRAAPGEVLRFVAINPAGDWLLLEEGNWVAVIALGAAPAGLPTSSDELVAALRERAALAPTPTPTPVPPTPLPTPAPTGPVTGTATTNANLRSGPGTTFDIVGNTTLGQLLTIVGRTQDGAWYLLDTGSWISSTLVAGAPPIAQIPIFDPNAPPTPTPGAPAAATPELEATLPATGTVPVTSTPSLLPTATPRAVALGVDENIYLVEFDNIAANYERALSAVDRLVDSASGNATVFADPQWVTDMNTAIQLIRNAGADVTQLAVPERFSAAHNSLVSAATQYNTAADLLAQGVRDAAVDSFEQAFASITLGDASMAQASAALSTYRP